MIRDASSVAGDARLDCDVCIVGAGAAGITLAMELRGSDLNVIVLEAGAKNRSGKSQELYRGTVNDTLRHLPPHTDRRRQLGGSTSIWGGRCIPFDAIDFEKRDYVPHSEWPVTRDALDSYYSRAQRYCESGDYDYSSSSLVSRDETLIDGFEDSDVVTDTIERWSPPTNFGKKYGNSLHEADNITVILNAVATDLMPSDDAGSIECVEVKTLRKKRFFVAAKTIVLAGGGLESTRLLLASNKRHQTEIGNHSQWLGRGYMCHIHGAISKVTLQPAARNVIFGYEQDGEGIYCRRRFTMSPKAQKQHKILNFYALLDRPLLDDPSHKNPILSLAFFAKKLSQSWVSKNNSANKAQENEQIGSGKYALYIRHLKNIFSGSAQMLTVLPKFSRSRFLHNRRIPSLVTGSANNQYSLYYQSEQVPNRDSFVELDEHKDALGVPRIKINFQVTGQDIDSVFRAHQKIDKALRKHGCGYLEFENQADDHVGTKDPRELIKQNAAVLGHHIGTTRMAENPVHGVVDGNCKVHHANGLYVAGACVFPTSSQANPTLTIVAMSIRLADHLKEKLL